MGLRLCMMHSSLADDCSEGDKSYSEVMGWVCIRNAMGFEILCASQMEEWTQQGTGTGLPIFLLLCKTHNILRDFDL